MGYLLCFTFHWHIRPTSEWSMGIKCLKTKFPFSLYSIELENVLPIDIVASKIRFVNSIWTVLECTTNACCRAMDHLKWRRSHGFFTLLAYDIQWYSTEAYNFVCSPRFILHSSRYQYITIFGCIFSLVSMWNQIMNLELNWQVGWLLVILSVTEWATAAPLVEMGETFQFGCSFSCYWGWMIILYIEFEYSVHAQHKYMIDWLEFYIPSAQQRAQHKRWLLVRTSQTH